MEFLTIIVAICTVLAFVATAYAALYTKKMYTKSLEEEKNRLTKKLFIMGSSKKVSKSFQNGQIILPLVVENIGLEEILGFELVSMNLDSITVDKKHRLSTLKHRESDKIILIVLHLLRKKIVEHDIGTHPLEFKIKYYSKQNLKIQEYQFNLEFNISESINSEDIILSISDSYLEIEEHKKRPTN